MRRLAMIAKVALALGLLAWLVRSGRLDLAALASGHLPSLHAAGMSLLAVAVVLQSVRWWRLLAVQEIRLPFPRVLRITWIGYFYALFLPGIGGGDVVRGLYVFREATGAKLRATATVVVDRAIGLYASLCLAGVAAISAGRWGSAAATTMRPLQLTVGALLALCSLSIAAVLWQPSRALLHRLLVARIGTGLPGILDAFAARRRALALCFLLSLASSASFLTAFWVAGRLLRLELSAAQVLLVVPLVLIANALPISPGGVGVGETAAAVLFAACGIGDGATLMLMVRVWQALVRVPGLVMQVGGTWTRRSRRGPVEPG